MSEKLMTVDETAERLNTSTGPGRRLIVERRLAFLRMVRSSVFRACGSRVHGSRNSRADNRSRARPGMTSAKAPPTGVTRSAADVMANSHEPSGRGWAAAASGEAGPRTDRPRRLPRLLGNT